MVSHTPAIEDLVTRLRTRASEAAEEAEVLRVAIVKIDDLLHNLLSHYNPGWVMGPTLWADSDGSETHLFIGRHRGASGLGLAETHPALETSRFVGWLRENSLKVMTQAIDSVPEVLQRFEEICQEQVARNRLAARKAKELLGALEPLADSGRGKGGGA